MKVDTENVLFDVSVEREQQDRKWGEQNHPDGTGGASNKFISERTRANTDRAFQKGEGTWRHILQEEVWEAFAESDPERLRGELIQVAAVAVAWVEAIDRRSE